MKGEVYASDASHLWRVPLRNDECNCESVQYNRNMHTCCCAYKLSSLRARVYDRVILLSYPLHTIAFISSYFTSAEHTHTGTRTRVPHTYSCAPERPPSLSLSCVSHTHSRGSLQPGVLQGKWSECNSSLLLCFISPRAIVTFHCDSYHHTQAHSRTYIGADTHFFLTCYASVQFRAVRFKM